METLVAPGTTESVPEGGGDLRVMRYKIVLSRDQEALFTRVLETQRRLYNRAILYREMLWECHRRRISHGDLVKRLVTAASARSASKAPETAPLPERFTRDVGFDPYDLLRQIRRYNRLVYIAEQEGSDTPPTPEEIEAARPSIIPTEDDIHAILAHMTAEAAPYLQACPRRVNSETLRRVEAALKGYFELMRAYKQGRILHPPGRPRPKPARDWRVWGFDAWVEGCALDEEQYLVPGPISKYLIGKGESRRTFGRIKMLDYRPVAGDIRTVEFIRTFAPWQRLSTVDRAPVREHGSLGEWQAHITVKLPASEIAVRPYALPSVGIDIGVSKLTLSDGIEIAWGGHGARERAPFLDLSRQMSARRGPDSRLPGQKVSGRYRAAESKMKKLSAHIARARDEEHKRIAANLARRYSAIYYDDLPVRALVRTPDPAPDAEGPDGSFLPNGAARQAAMNRRMLDTAPRAFIARLASACEACGTLCQPVGSAGLNQECSNCGSALPEMSDDEQPSAYVLCPSCKTQTPRALNSARNALRRAAL